MHHRTQSGVRLQRIERAHELGRMSAHDREERRDRVHDAGHAAKRQRRCAEARNLPIGRVHERTYQVHGIGRGLLAVVVVIKRVEARREPECGHVRSA